MSRIVRSAFLAVVISVCVLDVYALAPGEASATLVSDPFLVLDSNNPCVDGPNVSTIAVRVTNTSGGTLTGLTAVLGGFDPGFALVSANTKLIGTLASGASRDVYWQISHSCTLGTTDTLTVTLANDQPGTVAANFAVTTASTITANAGGLIVSQTIGAGSVLGQIGTIDVQYSFGGYAAGDLLNFAAAATQVGTGHLVTVRYYYRNTCLAGGATNVLPYAALTSGAVNRKYSGNYGTCDVAIPCQQTPPAIADPFTGTLAVSPGSGVS